jgi:hypothetical protein
VPWGSSAERAEGAAGTRQVVLVAEGIPKSGVEVGEGEEEAEFIGD